MFKAVDKAIEHIPADDDPLNILQSLLDSKISPYDYEILDYVYKKLNQLIGDQDHEEQQKIHGMFIKRRNTKKVFPTFYNVFHV